MRQNLLKIYAGQVFRLVAVFMLLGFFLSCSKIDNVGNEDIPEDEPEVMEHVIRFSTVDSGFGVNTRAMIGRETKGDFVSISDNCLKNSTDSRGISMYAERWTFDDNGDNKTLDEPYFLLDQELKSNKISGNRYSWAPYFREGENVGDMGPSRFWNPNERYIISAFYPSSIAEDIVHEASSATTTIIEHNTHFKQEDIMLAFNEVITTDPVTGEPSIYRRAMKTGETSVPAVSEVTNQASTNSHFGYSESFNYSAVPLYFKHTMAAVRVRFYFDYNNRYDDAIVYCAFVSKAKESFATIGTLVYGNGVQIKSGMTESEISRHNAAKDHFEWSLHHTLNSEEVFYEWSVDGSGIEFSSDYNTVNGKLEVKERMAIAFTDHVEDNSIRTTTYKGANKSSGVGSIEDENIYGTTPLSFTSDNIYHSNNGWVLVIPQQLTEDGLKLRYKLRSSSGYVEVNIPAITGTTWDMKTGEVKREADGTFYAPGYLYTYNVGIKPSGYSIGVSISPWRELYSSKEIVF